MVSFHNVGALLGRLSPRCSDPLPAIRAAAIDCIYSLLYIQLRYEGTHLCEKMYTKILTSVCYIRGKKLADLCAHFRLYFYLNVFFCRVLLGL